MTTPSKPSLFALTVLLAGFAAALGGCDDAPTTAVVENGFGVPAASNVGGANLPPTSVVEVWWLTTLFPSAVGPGATSEIERAVPGTDFAYALLAPGWSPGDGGRPARLVAVKSAAELSVAAHGRLRIVVSNDAFTGDCDHGPPLDADDARLITERIFPGAFAGKVYDPATCTTSDVPPQDGLAPADAADDTTGGLDAPADAGAAE
jgi:hypothetical protein